MTDAKLTVVDRIVLAAADIDSSGKSFTAEDLIVAAWKRFPEQFGLQGFAHLYPDSNRVLTKIMGSESPLRKGGLLRKVGTKRYKLTDAGREAARRLSSSETGGDGRLSSLSRSAVGIIKQMLTSSAYARHVRAERLTFGDVCGFWNISPRSNAFQLASRVQEAATALDLAIRFASDAGGTTSLPGDVRVRLKDLEELRELAQKIERDFATELSVIRSRQDERKAQ